MLRQLTDQDASFLYFETVETPAHVGGLSLVELPPGDRGTFYDDYKALIANRLRHVPFMHAKLRFVPLDLDRPFWIEDDEVDLDYHVRHVTAPKPGRMADLEELVALLHGTLLDRTRPLWELYVIDGLESGQVAIYSKIHHAAMDGASSRALVSTIYDVTPATRRFIDPPPDGGANRGDFKNLVEGLLGHVAKQELRALKFVPQLLHAFSELLLPKVETLRFENLPESPRTPRTPFNVGITNQRVYVTSTLPLGVVKGIAKQTGTTVNDVVLSLCSGALRSYLGAKGQLPETSLTAMVPVGTREKGDEDVPNRNGMFACSLASDIADPVERLMAIHRSALDQKKRFEALKVLPAPDVSLPGMSVILPQLVELFGRSTLADKLPLYANLVISNVPGPPVPLYVAGAKILTMFPCSIPFHGAALNITVQGYCDRLDFGLIACRRAVPDIRVLADALVESLSELMKALARTATAAPPVAAAKTVDGGQSHDEPHPGSPPDRSRPAAPQHPAPGPARDAREAEAPRHRHQKAPREPAQGHRGAALRK